jgi:hypothetical protein
MPLKAVADLFEQRLIENWTETLIISYDTIAEPPDVPAFVVQQYPVVSGSQPVLGRRFFEDGVYRLVLNVRRGIGLAQGLTWTDELAALFRSFKFPSGQLETFVPDGPIVDDNSEEGDWIVYSLIIPYRYQYDSM